MSQCLSSIVKLTVIQTILYAREYQAQKCLTFGHNASAMILELMPISLRVPFLFSSKAASQAHSAQEIHK
ncbi:hypothetical protein ABKN59_004554 [Abortiporus biennis]